MVDWVKTMPTYTVWYGPMPGLATNSAFMIQCTRHGRMFLKPWHLYLAENHRIWFDSISIHVYKTPVSRMGPVSRMKYLVSLKGDLFFLLLPLFGNRVLHSGNWVPYWGNWYPFLHPILSTQPLLSICMEVKNIYSVKYIWNELWSLWGCGGGKEEGNASKVRPLLYGNSDIQVLTLCIL